MALTGGTSVPPAGTGWTWPPSLADPWPRTSYRQDRRWGAARLMRITLTVFALAGSTAYLVGAQRADRLPPAMVLVAVTLGAVTCISVRTARLPSLLALLGVVVVTPFVFASSMMLGIACFACATELSASAAICAGGLASIVHIMAVALSRHSPVGQALDDVVLTMPILLAGVTFLVVARATSSAADASRADDIASRLVDRLSEERHRSTLAAHDLIHGALISTLLEVADHTSDDAGLRRACRSVAADLRGFYSLSLGSSVAEVVRAVAARVGVAVEVEVDRVGLAPRVADAQQADPLHLAISEGLRNAKRYAGDGSVRAVLAWDATQGHLRLHSTTRSSPSRDDGGWGLQDASAAMARIGGTVELDLDEEGATFSLTWPSRITGSSAGLLERTYDATRVALGHSNRLIWTITGPVLGAHTWVALRHGVGGHHLLDQVVLAAALIVLTVLIGRRLGERWVGWPALVGLSSLAATACATGVAIAGADSLGGYSSWFVGMSSVGITLAAFFTPPRVGLVLPLPSIAVIAAAASLDPRLGIGGASGPLVAIMVPPVLASVMGELLRRSVLDSELERERIEEVTRTVFSTLSREHSDRLLGDARRLVLPWLERAADRPLTSEPTRNEARLLAALARDELYLPGVLDDALRWRIAERRQQGVRIRFDAPDPDQEVTAAAPCLRLVDRLLDSTSLEAMLVTLPVVGRPDWGIEVVPPPDPVWLEQSLNTLSAVAWTIEQGTFATTVRCTGLPRSPYGGSQDGGVDV